MKPNGTSAERVDRAEQASETGGTVLLPSSKFITQSCSTSIRVNLRIFIEPPLTSREATTNEVFARKEEQKEIG